MVRWGVAMSGEPDLQATCNHFNTSCFHKSRIYQAGFAAHLLMQLISQQLNRP
jgi:hypothetical protein